MNDPLEIRRKRLRYRAWHRGTKELDLLLGTFADSHLADMEETELEAFEVLCNLPETILYRWVTGAGTLPDHADDAIAQDLLAFSRGHLPEILQDAEK